ncbi:MAG: glutamine-hydrolyzing carbamoyl-phosphate synthase small subunit [Theionarchaea archaeon]|nr:glutamine-hydrolyzing carbamoyl-phosphate synthase small subunit [Theionarchaea archaeon]
MHARLLLEDGTILVGRGFGSPGIRYGELVFSTGMVGYPESLTDPSYRGHLLTMTYPLIGNYGVPRKDITHNGIPLHFESERIQVEGFIISTLTRSSHWACEMELDEWLKTEQVPGICSIDTRMLVKHIRSGGVMMGALVVGEEVDEDEIMATLHSMNYDDQQFLDMVSPPHPIIHESPNWTKTVVVVDCGIKYGILRELMNHGHRVIRIPATADPFGFLEEYHAHGLVFGNGPGNPALLTRLIETARQVIESGIPTLGICLGSQVLALADGATVYKLPYGHRGLNKPVKDLKTGKAFVTTQNHGYAVQAESLDEFSCWMINCDDKSVEGIYHPRKPIIAVQFHPEASPGPTESSWIFQTFSLLMRGDGSGF